MNETIDSKSSTFWVAVMGFITTIISSVVTGYFTYSAGSIQAGKDITLMCVSSSIDREKIIREKSDKFLVGISDLLSELRNTDKINSIQVKNKLALAQSAAFSMLAYSPPEISQKTLQIIIALDIAVTDAGRNKSKLLDVVTNTTREWPTVYTQIIEKIKSERGQCFSSPNKSLQATP